MKLKAEFITVKPKSLEAKSFFDAYMRGLHSCKVIKRKDNQILLNSIAGDVIFWMQEKEDQNWEVIK